MSVIIRNTSGGSGGSNGTGKGFPPGDATNIKSTFNNGKVFLKWTDPENTVVNGTTLSSWKGTIVVRKTGSYPTSIKDGTVIVDNTTKNKYQSSWFIDSGLTNGTTYYYRFYTYNSDKIYNDSSNMVISVTPMFVDSTLKNNTWEIIAKVAESGTASTTWNIGDEIDIDGNIYLFHDPVTLQIWDFNHYEKSDGSGKAGIVFGCKGLSYTTIRMDPSRDVDWGECEMRSYYMSGIYDSLPDDLKNVVKEVKITAMDRASGVDTLNDKIFIPTIHELGADTTINGGESDGEYGDTKFPIFTDDNSRIKNYIYGSTNIEQYWTRTLYYFYGNSFYTVHGGGNFISKYTDNSDVAGI